MRHGWQVGLLIALTLLLVYGSVIGVSLYTTKHGDEGLHKAQLAACARGNDLRRRLTENAEANRDGWKVARTARRAAARAATNRREIVLNTVAAEKYSAVITRIMGLGIVDCVAVVK